MALRIKNNARKIRKSVALLSSSEASIDTVASGISFMGSTMHLDATKTPNDSAHSVEGASSICRAGLEKTQIRESMTALAKASRYAFAKKDAMKRSPARQSFVKQGPRIDMHL